jgi:NAD(P)-dependent dehydrogenase (short-subunit alcohol dehydrogenase family)
MVPASAFKSAQIPLTSLVLLPLSAASIRTRSSTLRVDIPRRNDPGSVGVEQPAELRSTTGRQISTSVAQPHCGSIVAASSRSTMALSRSSAGSPGGRSTPTTPTSTDAYDPWRAYGQSKLADVHFMLELDRRSGPQGCRAKSIVVHPGFTNTDLQARSVRETGGCRSQRFFRAAVQRFGMTPAQGALPLLRRPPTREPLAAPCTSRAGQLGAARPPARSSAAPGTGTPWRPCARCRSARPASRSTSSCRHSTRRGHEAPRPLNTVAGVSEALRRPVRNAVRLSLRAHLCGLVPATNVNLLADSSRLVYDIYSPRPGHCGHPAGRTGGSASPAGTSLSPGPCCSRDQPNPSAAAASLSDPPSGAGGRLAWGVRATAVTRRHAQQSCRCRRPGGSRSHARRA